MRKGFVYSVSSEQQTNSITLHFKELVPVDDEQTSERTEQTFRNETETRQKIIDSELKISNFKPNFFIKKPPFISKIEFENRLRSLDVAWEIRKFHDGNWTNGTSMQDFYDIFGDYENVLRSYWNLRKFAMERSFLNLDTWTFEDEVDFNNTENPFRYSKFLSPRNWQYVLSTRENISICGINSFPSEDEINYLDSEKLKEIKSTHENFDPFVKVLAYDIETYTKNNMNPELKENEIMCIGICFFILSSNIPYRRICLITKPVNPARKGFIEFTENDPISTEYVSFRDEREMLKAYVKLLQEENPLIIVGFNNFGFDDRFVFERMKRYGLNEQFLRCFSYDSTAEFRKIDLKIDGIQQNDNLTIIGNKIFTIDVFKYMLKANPKLYTQQAKGNLNSMLSLNKIKSPWDNVSDIQKTGLTYSEMFSFWDGNVNIREIAYYCVNDALCAGLLLIKMGLLQDKIKLGETSCSSLYDSLYREVSEKVLTKIEEFGWKNRFCLSDDTLGIKRPSKKDFEIQSGKKIKTESDEVPEN